MKRETRSSEIKLVLLAMLTGIGLYLDELAERSPFRQSTQTGHT